MKQALKNFGLGLVYFFLLPVFLVLVAVAGIYALLVIIVSDVKGLIRFFKGDKFFEPLPEDIRVEEIKEYRASLQTAPTPTPAPQPENHVYIQQNYYQQNPQQQSQPQDQQPQINQTPMSQATYIDATEPQQSQGYIPNEVRPEQIPAPQQTPAVAPTQYIDISNADQGGDNL